MAVPNICRHLMKRELVPPKCGCIHVRSPQQSPIQPVRPPMIWTNETPAAVTLTLIADLRPTMPANVVKGSNRIFGFADDNDAFASNVPQKIVAYARDLLC